MSLLLISPKHFRTHEIYKGSTLLMSDQVGFALERVSIAHGYFSLLDSSTIGKRADRSVMSGMRFLWVMYCCFLLVVNIVCPSGSRGALRAPYVLRVLKEVSAFRVCSSVIFVSVAKCTSMHLPTGRHCGRAPVKGCRSNNTLRPLI